MISKISHVLLNSMAYFILEPRFRSGRWIVPEETLAQLKPSLERMYAAYDTSRAIFLRVDVCHDCGGICCTGNYNRFTVYDHVSHLIACYHDAPDWKYTLHPFKSAAVNRAHDGLCPHVSPGKGCAYEYHYRPSVCIWWTCDKIQERLTADDRRTLRQVRSEIDKVLWKYALTLLFGGMRRKTCSKTK
jgi:hypothetical protein